MAKRTKTQSPEERLAEFRKQYGSDEEAAKAWAKKYHSDAVGAVGEENLTFTPWLKGTQQTPGDRALDEADKFRNAILENRIAERKRRTMMDERMQRAAQAAARQRMGGAGFFQPKGGTIMTGPLGVMKARMSATPTGILDYKPMMAQPGRTASNFNAPTVVSPGRTATNLSAPTAVMNSRMERVRLASSSNTGTFGGSR